MGCEVVERYLEMAQPTKKPTFSMFFNDHYTYLGYTTVKLETSQAIIKMQSLLAEY